MNSLFRSARPRRIPGSFFDRTLRRLPGGAARIFGILFAVFSTPNFNPSALAAEGPPHRFDAAPFGSPLPAGRGVVWEDPREIHEVVVRFKEPVRAPGRVRLEYWGSRWPTERLPKDREPGGGNVGWMELGNWHAGGWRAADADAKLAGNEVSFIFHPVSDKEFPQIKDYAAPFRYTLKIRAVPDASLPAVESIRAYTDSTLQELSVRLVWKEPAPGGVEATVFNGSLAGVSGAGLRATTLRVMVVHNPDPNTFDRTLVTVKGGGVQFTFKVDDLAAGPLYLPEYGIAVLPGGDARDYAAVERDNKPLAGRTLYDTAGRMPEQTWRAAWNGMPPKKSRICFPLARVSQSRRKL